MRKGFSCLLVLVLVLSLGAPAVALSSVVQHEYSAEANSGIRHQLCTTLEGTSAAGYYTDTYSFDKLSALSGDALLESLRTLMTTTHTRHTTYHDCWGLMVKTDCQKGDDASVNLLYSGYVFRPSEHVNDAQGGWSLEHVWPESLGGFQDSGAGADLHHVRPADSALISARGSEKYGNASDGEEIFGAPVIGGASGGKKGGGYMEPLDNVKGDVARICLYMYVRYGKDYLDCGDITNVFQSVEVLLQWCALDPVDTWEMGRNEVVYAIQGNRNVFIDYPELAWQLFDRECPEGMTTPSGNAAICRHKNKVIRYVQESTCGLAGYTGDLCCRDCGQRLKAGRMIQASGKHSFGQWQSIKGSDGEARSCTVCGFQQTRQQETDGNLWIWIAVAAGVVTVCAVAAVIRIKNKKKR